jgi:hypothetical protein
LKGLGLVDLLEVYEVDWGISLTSIFEFKANWKESMWAFRVALTYFDKVLKSKIEVKVIPG